MIFSDTLENLSAIISSSVWRQTGVKPEPVLVLTIDTGFRRLCAQRFGPSMSPGL